MAHFFASSDDSSSNDSLEQALGEARKWIADVLRPGLCWRINMTREEQRIAYGRYKDDDFILYAPEIAVIKYAASDGRYPGAQMQFDALGRGDVDRDWVPIEQKQLESLACEIKRKKLHNNPASRYCAALVEAQCGFYHLKPKEFEALQRPMRIPEFAEGARDAGECSRSRPRSLTKLSYNQFMDIVDEVHHDNDLPLRAEYFAKRMPLPQTGDPQSYTKVNVPVSAVHMAMAKSARDATAKTIWKRRNDEFMGTFLDEWEMDARKDGKSTPSSSVVARIKEQRAKRKREDDLGI